MCSLCRGTSPPPSLWGSEPASFSPSKSARGALRSRVMRRMPSAKGSVRAKYVHGAQGLAPTSARSCPSSRRRSAPSARSAGATSSPSTRIGDARRRAGTMGGARGALQVVAAPGARHVRDLYAPPSTAAAMCAPPSSPPEFRAKFGGASRATRLKSREEGHARRSATLWGCGDRPKPSCESSSSREHLLDRTEFDFTRVFGCAALGGVLRSSLYESP